MNNIETHQLYCTLCVVSLKWSIFNWIHKIILEELGVLKRVFAYRIFLCHNKIIYILTFFYKNIFNICCCFTVVFYFLVFGLKWIIKFFNGVIFISVWTLSLQMFIPKLSNIFPFSSSNHRNQKRVPC